MQTKSGNIFTSVCQEFCSQGGACSTGDLLRGTPGPGGCLVQGGFWSRECLVPGDVCSQGVSAPGGVCSRGVSAPGDAWSWGVPGGDPPTAAAAGGTHPTVMHSC